MTLTTALILMALSAMAGATTGIILMAIAVESGRHRTSEDDREQAAILAARMHGDGSL